jgi:hypothetical protein
MTPEQAAAALREIRAAVERAASHNGARLVNQV